MQLTDHGNHDLPLLMLQQYIASVGILSDRHFEEDHPPLMLTYLRW